MSRFVLFSQSTGLFYAGEIHDNGSYGSGYRLHDFKLDQAFIFQSADLAYLKHSEILTDPEYLRNGTKERASINDLDVIQISFAGFDGV